MSYSLSFSKAILVVVFISDKIRQGQYEFLSTASIAKVLNIPKPTLVKILQGLAAQGIIETKEGKHGGVRGMKDAAAITVLDVFDAVEKGKPLFQSGFDIAVKGCIVLWHLGGSFDIRQSGDASGGFGRGSIFN